VVADLYQQHHDPQAARHWIERGLQLETQGRRGASYRLTELQQSVLHQLHRPKEALALAWHDFQVAPSTFTYKTLMAEAPEGRSHPLAYPSDGSGGAV